MDTLSDISYISEIFLISDFKSKIVSKNYKIKIFKSNYIASVTLNNLIKISKYDKIIVSDFEINSFFFKLNNLDGNNFFINKSRTFCYFDIIQFLQLNGFHQDSIEYIYNFGLRLEENGFNKIIIHNEFDKSEKKFLKVDKDLKIWNKECEQLKVNIRKSKEAYYLI